jgi:thiamine biosynthesis lipoprotein
MLLQPVSPVRIATLLAACLWGCAKPPVEFTSTREQMGTAVSIRVIGRDKDACTKAGEAAFARIDELNALMSDYVRTSDVSRVSAASGGVPQPVAPETFTVVELATDWFKRTSFTFDVTIRPAIRLWRKAMEDEQLPTPEQLAAVRGLLQAQNPIELDKGKRTIRLPKAGMSLDLGGIAKGYIVDQAIATLEAHGVRSAIIDAGGDVYALGGKSAEEAWRVAIENPPPGDDRYIILGVCDRGVATSGDYRRGFTIADKHYSHIIDPRTAMPAENVPSATVIAADLTTADVLATAVSVLGPDEGLRLIDSLPGTEALIIYRQAAMLRAVASKGFARYVVEGQERLDELTHGNH